MVGQLKQLEAELPLQVEQIELQFTHVLFEVSQYCERVQEELQDPDDRAYPGRHVKQLVDKEIKKIIPKDE